MGIHLRRTKVGDIAPIPLRLSLDNFLCYRENTPTLDFIINYDIKYRLGQDRTDEGGGE
jgi:hypothetical protein